MTRSARPDVTIWADGNGTVVASGALVSTYVDDFRHVVDAEDGSGGADGLVLDLTAVTEMDPAAAAAVAGIAADRSRRLVVRASAVARRALADNGFAAVLPDDRS